MSSIDVNHAPAAEGGQAEQDLGPLAWVLDELRKSLDGAVKAMRRFVRDAELAHESDLAALDAGPLRIARQQLHQASGALEMVGLAPPAFVLRAMESAVQKFVHRPELCTDDAASVIERASFALIEYLEYVLAGKSVSPVALFPQYRDAQALAGAERVHPADLWPVERRFREPEFTLSAAPLPYGPEARARLDSAVLRIVKSGDLKAADSMHDTCLGFVAAQSDRSSRIFWKICAGFFEAFAQGLLPPDVYVKRVASRVLMQYATLAKGDTTIADRLLQDLLFFCAQARLTDADATDVPTLQAVRQTFGLNRFEPVDYETARFGRFDPALLVQARKRIAAATETWSALAGGDRNKLKPAADQFSLVCDSLRKLQPGSQSLAQALTRALDATTRAGEPPSAALAMEVATAVLYLQAAFEELDTADGQMELRAARLAERLDAVGTGAEPEPLEPWMEELYRRVSDKQTMGSVVDELRATLGEIEKALDQFFRTPQDTATLATVPRQLAQMRGVLSVLGLDQASLAVVRMRDTVDRLLINEVPQEDCPQVFEKLGNSLGALGFLIDMLSYQRTMARKLFVYDEALGELRILTGKTRPRTTDNLEEALPKLQERSAVPLPAVVPRFPVQEPVSEPTDFGPLFDLGALPASTPEPALEPEISAWMPEISLDLPPHGNTGSVIADLSPSMTAAAAAAAPAVSAIEDDLLEVFLEEAREVVANGLAAIDILQHEPGNLSEQTSLRRAFHTLKGSSRMVGLNDFGEAAWSLEQMLNVWLAEQKAMPSGLLQLSSDALQAFGRWADDIAAGTGGAWQPEAFRKSAEAMLLDGAFVPLALPSMGAEAERMDSAAPDEAVAPEAAVPAPPERPPLSVEAEPAPPATLASAAETAVVAEAAALEPDFADAHLSAAFPDIPFDLPAEDLAPAAAAAEDIDFSVFAAALTESDGSPTPVGALLPIDLELPDAAVALPALEDVPGEVAATAAPEHLPEFPGMASLPGMDGVADALAEISQAPETADGVIESWSPEPTLEAPSHAAEPPQVSPLNLVPAEEGVKVIDSLRIGIALYNVYLNEADEWSRRLDTCLQEWSLELQEPLPDTAVALAHSLAGSSATVGFTALSEMARVLEHALQHVQLQSGGAPAQARVFMAAANDIRRLLHQFAAGFLKEPNAQVLEDLRQILQMEVVSTLSPPPEELDDLSVVPELADIDAHMPEVPAEPEPEQAVRLEENPVVSFLPAMDDTRGGSDMDDAVAQVVTTGVNVDDDIDALDVIDPDLFPIFEEEAAELLPRLGGALRQWASRPDNLGARSQVLRDLHTLKGSSRLAGAMRLGEMAHRLESSIEQLDTENLKIDQIEPLLGRFDGLQANFEALRAMGERSADQPVVALPAAHPKQVDGHEQLLVAAHATFPASTTRVPLPVVQAPVRMAANQAVRVRAQLLDRLVNQAGEVMISRSRLDAHLGQFRSSLTDLSGNLERLRQQLRDIEVQSESQMQSRLALSKDSAAGFDPLEFDRFTRVQELTRMMAESVNDVATVQRNLQRTMEGAEDELMAQGRQARELQRDLLRTRMVEFDGIAERLYAVVRQASKETGKQIKLNLTGGSIEMDRGVLDRMTPAFEHLLRNCVVHGIEKTEARLAAGKSASGTITVDLKHDGNDVSVEFRDDGSGLDLLRIREKALTQGLIAADTALNEDKAANLIFMPGFSTAAEVTGLAGRGIGLDVVRSEVNALGGRIETSTEAGKGTAFRMVLPLTTAVTQVVMLRAGDLAIGVPANIVEMVRRTSVADLQEAYRTGYFDDGLEQLPFFWTGALLQASTQSNEPARKHRPVVIFRSAAQRMALHVDEVLGNQEVVVKNLGPQLSRLPGLAGMSVLASGAVVLIYNPVALATVYGEQVRAAGLRLPSMREDSGAGTKTVEVSTIPSGPGQMPLVLVVDDSITVRRVTQRLLQREGYRVVLAADGLQALARLQEERPTVMLSDIEMPRMDGFDLARNIRADSALHDLPIIMITSRIASKHREHAKELGVNHYLGKPYSDEELLSIVRHYAQLQAQATV